MVSREPEERRRAFGEAVRQALRVKQMTQEELAAALNKTQPMISAWIQGKRAPESPELAFEVERAIGVDPGTLSVHLGFIPPEAARTVASFESVVLADTGLSDDEKELMMAMYKAATSKRRRPRKR